MTEENLPAVPEKEGVEVNEKFEDFFDDEDLGDLAKLLDEVNREYRAENLSLLEFIEVTDDLIQSKKIADLTDNVDRQKLIQQTFETIKVLVNLAIGAPR